MDPRVDWFREDVTLFDRRLRTKRADHLLTSTQLQIIGHLDRIGAMSAKALADLEQVTPQSIARVVSRLEELGMISRTTDPTDARANILAITDIGHRTLVEDRSRRSAWLAEALGQKCTEAERELLFIAGRLLRRLSEAPECADDAAGAVQPVSARSVEAR